MTIILIYILFITTCFAVGIGFTIFIHYTSWIRDKIFGLIIFVFSVIGLLQLSSEALLCNDIETLQERIQEIQKDVKTKGETSQR